MSRPLRTGFTLHEMLAVVAVLAILAALAAPSFAGLRDEWRLRAAARTLTSALARTRAAALAAGTPASLCPSEDGGPCAPGGANGYLSRLDEDAALPVERGRLPGGVWLRMNRAAVTYYATPRAASPVTLTLCAGPARRHSRLLIVSQTGRPRIERAGVC